MKTKTLALALALVLLLTACASPPAETTAPTTAPTTVPTTAPIETTVPSADPIRYPLNADSSYADLAQPLPDSIYTTPADENGLAGTVYTFDGVAIRHSATNSQGYRFEQITVSASGGDVIISNYYKAHYDVAAAMTSEESAALRYPHPVEDFCFPEDGTTAEYLVVYVGYSETAKMPVFALGANPSVFEILDLPDPLGADNPEPTEPVETTEPPRAATTGERNALKQALSYLDFSNFSYSGLIDQLEYEGYTTEEATYAADNCGADWKAQALGQAKSYLSFSAFSYSGLIDQLEYEGYTADEAAYAADNCGADWMEQAAKCAESYLEFSSFSRSRLIEQLEYEGFTHEQAVYGAEQNGY